MEEEGSNPGGSSLTAALNRDALEEVFVHCSPADLLAAAQSCRTAADLLHRSERVWTAKLRESYGMGLKVGVGWVGVGVVPLGAPYRCRLGAAEAASGGWQRWGDATVPPEPHVLPCVLPRAAGPGWSGWPVCAPGPPRV